MSYPYRPLPKTYVTPELRTAVRQLMRTCRAVPTCAANTEQADIITKMIPLLADSIPDADIDAVILQMHKDGVM